MNKEIYEAVREILRGHMFHYFVDEDNWYSCPKAPEGCSDDSKGDKCDCGLEERINTLAKSIAEAVPEKKILTSSPEDVGMGQAYEWWNAFRTKLKENRVNDFMSANNQRGRCNLCDGSLGSRLLLKENLGITPHK